MPSHPVSPEITGNPSDPTQNTPSCQPSLHGRSLFDLYYVNTLNDLVPQARGGDLTGSGREKMESH
jgi:hypothetical protein